MFVLKHLLSLLRALLKSAIYLVRTNFTGASSQAGIACCTETMTSRRFRFGSNNLCCAQGLKKIEKDCLETRHGQRQHSTERKLMTLPSSIGMAGSKKFGQLHTPVGHSTPNSLSFMVITCYDSYSDSINKSHKTWAKPEQMVFQCVPPSHGFPRMSAIDTLKGSPVMGDVMSELDRSCDRNQSRTHWRQ